MHLKRGYARVTIRLYDFELALAGDDKVPADIWQVRERTGNLEQSIANCIPPRDRRALNASTGLRVCIMPVDSAIMRIFSAGTELSCFPIDFCTEPTVREVIDGYRIAAPDPVNRDRNKRVLCLLIVHRKDSNRVRRLRKQFVRVVS